VEVSTTKSGLSTGVIARTVKCHISTALRCLRELKKAKQVIEQRISNTINLWKLTGKRILLVDVDSKISNLALLKILRTTRLRVLMWYLLMVLMLI
jgi:hypothetical protein